MRPTTAIHSTLGGLMGFLVLAMALLAPTAAPGAEKEGQTPSWNFVSFPDFFNFDVSEPEPKWDSAINYYLAQLKSEDPAFSLTAGDMVDGRWYSEAAQVEHLGNVYYAGWMRRIRRHDLTPVYTAIGDHELGDNPWPKKKAKLIPEFYEAFEEHMENPQNGPEGYLERTYAVRHRNMLVITLQMYERQDGDVIPTVGQTQLDWMKKTLDRHDDATFVIVQGHNPILPGVRARSSSKIMHKGKHKSELWQIMAERGVDLFFAGEFHDTTCRKHEGVWQVVHGASWGRGFPANYLLGEVRGDKLHLTVKEIPTVSKGGDIWNANKGNGPSEYVLIPEKHRKEGFKTIATMTIDKSGEQTRFINRTGRFTQEFDALE